MKQAMELSGSPVVVNVRSGENVVSYFGSFDKGTRIEYVVTFERVIKEIF